MLDPLTTPLLVLVLGRLAQELITDACKDHLKGKLKRLFGWVEKSGRKDELQLAYEDAMQDAYAVCLEKLLSGLELMEFSKTELAQYEQSLKSFVRDVDVAPHASEYLRENSHTHYRRRS